MLINKKMEAQRFGAAYVRELSESGEPVIYSVKDGEFFELAIELSKYKLLFLTFDLDCHMVRIELGEKGRKNRIKIFIRNFNGEMYVFDKNLSNLYEEIINFYTDYYNEVISVNFEIEQQIIEDVMDIITFLIDNPLKLQGIELDNGELNFVEILKEHKESFIPFLKTCKEKNRWSVLLKKESVKTIYKSELTVLPPDIRPDINNDYMIIQVMTGCRVMERRGKPCGFCTSFENEKCYEYQLDDIYYQINSLKKEYPKKLAKTKKIFLCDGDPLCMAEIVDIMRETKEYLKEGLGFEAFVSTATILETSDAKWQLLKENGLNAVYWGVESVSDEILRLIDKPQNSAMLEAAKSKLEKNGIPYYIIIMAGVGRICRNNNGTWQPPLENHCEYTSKFINDSCCAGVYISKLQVTDNSLLFKQKGKGDIKLMTDEEIENEYRLLIRMITKSVRGSYGNQFVVGGNTNV